MNETIFLIGYRGVGKTTIGQLLADRLGYVFIDTDQFICEQEGKSIRTLVDEGGWDTFRRSEKAALKVVSGKKKHVIATGGGAVLHQSLWVNLRESSVVIWLNAERDVVLKRLMGDTSTDDMRPSLTGSGLAEEIEEVLSTREPLYNKTSHIEIDTGDISIEETVEKLLAEVISFRKEEE